MLLIIVIYNKLKIVKEKKWKKNRIKKKQKVNAIIKKQGTAKKQISLSHNEKDKNDTPNNIDLVYAKYK